MLVDQTKRTGRISNSPIKTKITKIMEAIDHLSNRKVLGAMTNLINIRVRYMMVSRTIKMNKRISWEEMKSILTRIQRLRSTPIWHSIVIRIRLGTRTSGVLKRTKKYFVDTTQRQARAFSGDCWNKIKRRRTAVIQIKTYSQPRANRNSPSARSSVYRTKKVQMIWGHSSSSLARFNS